MKKIQVCNGMSIEVVVERVTNWARVLDAARFTQGKCSLDKEPSDDFKRKIVLSEHSPLRLLEFDIKVYGIPYFSMGHFVRHVHAQPFVSTSRPDITGAKATRHELPQDAPVNMQLSLNAQEILNISRLRLCNKAEITTRMIWGAVVSELREMEPILADACLPQCVVKGFCQEMKTCGYTGSTSFDELREWFLCNFDRYNS